MIHLKHALSAFKLECVRCGKTYGPYFPESHPTISITCWSGGRNFKRVSA